jgi:hypothetical protein
MVVSVTFYLELHNVIKHLYKNFEHANLFVFYDVQTTY